jgi:4-amino-4-deoxychorismate lyase
MCQFVETICIENGKPRNLSYHVQRLNLTMRTFFPESKAIGEHELLTDIPNVQGLQKARVVYDENGITERSFAPYSIRKINSIAIVEGNDISYSWKSTDRSALMRLREKAPDYDEVIIIKNGCVTDTSYTNLCFFDGKEWLTPDTPLLRGTMRQKLLDEGIIREARILKTDLHKFQSVSLINAMMPLGELLLSL